MRFRWILKRAVSVVERENCCFHCKHHLPKAKRKYFCKKPKKSFFPFSSLMPTIKAWESGFLQVVTERRQLASPSAFGVISGWQILITFREQKHNHAGHRFPLNEGQYCTCCFPAWSWWFGQWRHLQQDKLGESWSPTFQLQLSLVFLALLSAGKELQADLQHVLGLWQLWDNSCSEK